MLQIPHCLLRIMHCRMVAGDDARGMRALEEAIALASGAERRRCELLREVLEIDIDLRAGQTQRAADRLPAVLAEHRTQGNVMFLRHRPDVAARLADFALARGIETEFVRTLIARNALVAPAEAGAAWPFRLRVRALNAFEIARDGAPLRFSGKAQQRPLDLLKLLVALGGRDMDIQQATTSLWPDADGDSAKGAFDTALYRLRKL